MAKPVVVRAPTADPEEHELAAASEDEQALAVATLVQMEPLPRKHT